MGSWRFLHHHPGHRARQLRWVVPIVALLLAAALATLAVQYRVSDQAVGTEFFRAHKTISHTGDLLWRGTLIGGLVLVVLVLAIAAWALRLTHRIVRPVHTLHRALDALVAGDLRVRVELDRGDEFGEVGDALNRLVEEFATTLGEVHALVDHIGGLAAGGAPGAGSHLQQQIAELDRKMDFFRLGPPQIVRCEGK